MIPLNMVRSGESGTIVKISGRDSVRQHLAELGFVMGAEVSVQSEIAGSLILAVKDSRVALDRGMAGRVMVDPE